MIFLLVYAFFVFVLLMAACHPEPMAAGGAFLIIIVLSAVPCLIFYELGQKSGYSKTVTGKPPYEYVENNRGGKSAGTGLEE